MRKELIFGGMLFALVGATLPQVAMADEAMDEIAPGKPDLVESGTIDVEPNSCA